MSSLNSDQLDAFEAVARLRNFSIAAKALHISQSALSRRIQALEFELGHSVLVRSPAGVELTQEGHRLVEYVRNRQSLEEDLKADLGSHSPGRLAGALRIAGYSSVLHYVVAPALAKWLRQQPSIQLHFSATQGVRPALRQLSLVQRAEVDFLISTFPVKDKSLESHYLGKQTLVGIESTKHTERKNTFIDSRPEDDTTEKFFSANKDKKINYERSYLHDEEGILNGVALGLGRAVVFSSMLRPGLPIQKMAGWKTIHWAFYLVYRKQAVYSRLFQKTREVLLRELPVELP